MTDNVYPPDHLLRKWESLIIDEEQNVDVVLYEAFQAGADQELEACCNWLCCEVRTFSAAAHLEAQRRSDNLRAARRPKPPSLKEQALEALYQIESEFPAGSFGETIRRALESLPD